MTTRTDRTTTTAPPGTSGPHALLDRHRRSDGTARTSPGAANAIDDPALSAAVQCHVDGDLEGAVDRYRRLLDERAGDPTVTNNLGLALLQDGRPTEALAVLRRLEPIESLSPVALTNLANAHIATGDATTGVRLLERAVMLDPGSTAWASLGKARLVSGNVAGAAAALETAVGLFPGRTDVWRLLGSCLAALGDHGGALDALRVAAEQDPDNAATWRQLSELLILRSDLGSAVVAARRAVALDPTDVAGRRQLAIALVAIGDSAAASEQLDAVLDGGERRAWEFEGAGLDRAVIALASGDLGRARSLLEPLTESASVGPRARLHLAYVELASGRGDVARDLLGELVESKSGVATRAREILDGLAHVER